MARNETRKLAKQNCIVPGVGSSYFRGLDVSVQAYQMKGLTALICAEPLQNTIILHLAPAPALIVLLKSPTAASYIVG